MAADALRQLGICVERRDVERMATPSGRWLARRGVLLRRMPLPPSAPAIPSPGPSRCRHGLPGVIEVGTAPVSHSQHLCRAVGPDEVRRPPWLLTPTAQGDGVDAFEVTLAGEPAGTVWRVATPLGPAWVQSLAAARPGAAGVAAAVLAAQLAPRGAGGAGGRQGGRGT